MADTYETIADIIAEKRALADRMEHEMAVAKECKEPIAHRTAQAFIDGTRREADRLEAAHKRELQDALDCGGIVGAAHEREVATNMRSKLYGLAGSIHAMIARSDAMERGVHYTEVQNIAAQIENIADNGGEA